MGYAKTRLHLPDTLASWPFPRTINPFYAEVKVESESWVRDLNPFDARALRKFEACDFSLLTCLAYPRLKKEHIRTACDQMMLVFAFDEFSDVVDAQEAQKQADIIMDALHHPERPRPKGEHILGEMTRQFWNLALKTASETSAARFVDAFQFYAQSVVDQARDRDNNTIRSIAEYLEVRRGTIGARPSYALLELGMNIPEDVWQHPVIEILTICSEDMIILDNDMLSYNVEQARGDDLHNIIRIIMEERHTNVEGAMKWAENYHNSLKYTFVENYQNLPSFGSEVDKWVHEYVEGLAMWVTANVCWSFESKRYFGNHGHEVKRHRTVDLLPKRTAETQLKTVNSFTSQQHYFSLLSLVSLKWLWRITFGVLQLITVTFISK